MTPDPSLPRYEIHRNYHGDRCHARHGVFNYALAMAVQPSREGTPPRVVDVVTGETLWPEMGGAA